eukprot:TRINITY_DN15570_c0_g1_i5.p1 TRINITY_DN15570_c0_g1~~TRINITY_DN15570_c0_g1_i5.p1  ORF type:complete len:618 (+),score=272.25 TRINITY_DN15570_c0_g1_i5:60-1856(+)
MAEEYMPEGFDERTLRLRKDNDLSVKLSKYLDKHMMYFVVRHAQRPREVEDEPGEEGVGVLPLKEWQRLDLAMISTTLMVDYYKQRYLEYNPPAEGDEERVDAEITAKLNRHARDELAKRYEQLQADAQPFLQHFGCETPEDQEMSHKLFEELGSQEAVSTAVEDEAAEGQGAAPKQSLFNVQYLESEYGITAKTLNALYLYAKLLYQTGMYHVAADYLFYYRRLGPLEWDFNAIWGKLAADIMHGEGGGQSNAQALEGLGFLAKAIQQQEEKLASARPADSFYKDQEALANARAWFMHWSLFVHFRDYEGDVLYDDGLDRLVEGWKGPLGFVFGWLPDQRVWGSPLEKDKKQCQFLRIVQCVCPYLLRYIAAAVVIGMDEGGKRRDRDGTAVESGHVKMRNNPLKDLVRLVDTQKRVYRDPVTEFIEKLLVECDFEGAHQKLSECETVLIGDYFLHRHAQRFLVQGRRMIFENHTKVHSVMDIRMVAEKLQAERDVAERFIVNMIRNAGLDAKIDSEENRVLLAPQGNNIYKQVREKSKLARDRTDQLIERLQDKRDQQEEEEPRDGERDGRRVPRAPAKKTTQRRRNDYSNFFSGR